MNNIKIFIKQINYEKNDYTEVICMLSDLKNKERLILKNDINEQNILKDKMNNFSYEFEDSPSNIEYLKIYLKKIFIII